MNIPFAAIIGILFFLLAMKLPRLSFASENPVPPVAARHGIMGQARQSVQRLVDVMYKDGILDFLDNPNHKRAKYVILTTRGNKIYARLDEMWNPWASQHSRYINKEDLETTLATLKKIALLFEA